MGERRTGSPDSELAGLLEELQDIQRRITTLEQPDGNQLFQTVAQLQGLVNNIQAQLDAYNAGRYTNTEINNRDINPGLVGNVVSTGSASYTSLRADGGLMSTDVYSHLVTGGGAYRAVWVHESGFLGYAPSSRRFKVDIEDFAIDLTKIDDLRVRRFHYLAAVPYAQSAQPWTVGLIAEEVEALGMSWLIDYDDAGKPFGVRYELLALALIPALQRANVRLAKRLFQETTLTLAAFSVLGTTQEVTVTWPTEFADADYIVQAWALPPSGLLTAVGVTPVAGSRTAKSVKLRVTTNGIALGSGTQLTVSGVHL